MWQFFQTLGVIDAAGRPTEHFGDPLWVYVHYRRRKGDARFEEEIRREGQQQIDATRGRGVFIAAGHGQRPWDLDSQLHQDLRRIYDDAKDALWRELSPQFVGQIEGGIPLTTRSASRRDYILHPTTGEQLSDQTASALRGLRREQAGQFDVQLVISDGLNALSIMDPGHLAPYVERLRLSLGQAGYRPATTTVVFTSGRVRAGYRVGEALFGGLPGVRSIIHVIGERPGTGHHTFSAYITAAPGATWGTPGKTDHDITKVVSGMASTAILPVRGADETVRLLNKLVAVLRERS